LHFLRDFLFKCYDRILYGMEGVSHTVGNVRGTLCEKHGIEGLEADLGAAFCS
jgi:hypothetical protein